MHFHDLKHTSFSTWRNGGIFQYESAGMQKYMKELKRFSRFNCHECVIPPRTNCLYPEFCKRKNGEEEIIYDLEACEELLKDTYGITVYQEQVMLLSQN
jgi:DNA polymerase-3 subunit alpha